MKFYRFQCSNGDVYEIPLDEIIDSKAAYAFEHKWFDDMYMIDVIREIIKEFDNDPYLIEEWARNDMDWDDVKEYARLVPSEEKKMNMQDEWCNPNETKIVEYD